MSAAVDTGILIWGVRKQPDPARDDIVDRCIALISDLKARDGIIMVPSVVLAEYLAGYDDQVQVEAGKIIGKNFFVPPFDAKAAVIAAELFGKGDFDRIRGDHDVSRQSLKDDYKIVATAIAAGATTIYADDGQFTAIAKDRILVRPIPELRGPETLFELQGLTSGPQLPLEYSEEEPTDDPDALEY